MNLRIKEICKEQGLSIGELANTIGIVRESLSRIISSGSTSTDTLEKIATALNVEVTDLFEKTDGDFKCPNCGTALNISVEMAKGKEQE